MSAKEKSKKLSGKKKTLILSASAVVIVLLFIWGFLMKSIYYKVTSKKLTEKVKIVFISDLHNCFFGGFDQSGLMDAIDREEPDIVLFGGDLLDFKGGTKYSLRILEMVKEKYPCAYTCGNHEIMRDDRYEFFEQVEEMGIPVLHGECADIEVKGQPIRVYGVVDAYEYGKGGTQLENCYETLDQSYYNILLAHQPEQYKLYMGREKDDDVSDVHDSFDLILSGHAHGGQWRLPLVLEQGLYAPDQGIFPDYTTGQYTYGDTTHIISRGLAKPLRMIFIPRIFNRPELSVIEIDTQ